MTYFLSGKRRYVAMPIYEYKCKKCEQVSEFIKSINSNDKTVICPSCGGKAYRIVSQSSFILKGSGWYVTDYKGSKKNISPQDKKKTIDDSKVSEKPSKEVKETTKVEKAG